MIAVLMAIPSVTFALGPLSTHMVPKRGFVIPIPHSFAILKPLILVKKIVMIPHLYFEDRRL